MLQQRSAELTADEASAALCNLLHLSQYCASSEPQQPDNITPSALSVCHSLASQLLQPHPHPHISDAALVKLLTTCFRTQHLLPDLDLHTVMDNLWMKLMDDTSGTTLLQQLPANEFLHVLEIGSRLQLSSATSHRRGFSSTSETESGATVTAKNISFDTAQRTSDTILEPDLSSDTCKLWQQINNITQLRASAGDFSVSQLGELAQILRRPSGHWTMYHGSSDSSSEDLPDYRHSPSTSLVGQSLRQQMHTAPLDEVAAAAASLGRAGLLGDAAVLQDFSKVFGEDKLQQLSHAGLILWVEGIARAVVQTRRCYDSHSEEVASKLLMSAHAAWLAKGSMELTSTQQLISVYWSLACARCLQQSSLDALLAQGELEGWESIGPVDAVQLVYVCLKGHRWNSMAARGVQARLQQLLPVMDVRTLTKLAIMLEKTGHGAAAVSDQVWNALQTAAPASTSQQLRTLYRIACDFHKPQLQRVIIQHTMSQLNSSVLPQNLLPLLMLVCSAASQQSVSQAELRGILHRLTSMLATLEHQEVAALSFHLPSLGQVDRPFADKIAALSLPLLPSSSLRSVVRTLSGVHRLRGGGASDDYWTMMTHVLSKVTQGCSTTDMFHVSAWMLEPNALFSPELPDAVALAATELLPSDISPNLAVQLVLLISNGVIASRQVAAAVLDSLQHRVSSYSADQLVIVLSMLCDVGITVPQQHVDLLLSLLENQAASRRPSTFLLYNIFSTQQLLRPVPSIDASGLRWLVPVGMSNSLSTLPPWLSDMLHDPTTTLLETNRYQLCNVAQQWAEKFPHLRSLIYARLVQLAIQQSSFASVAQVMYHHGCNDVDHPDLSALIESAATGAQGNRKRFIL